MLNRFLLALTALLPTAAFAGSMMLGMVGGTGTFTPPINLVAPVFVLFSGLTGTANHFGFMTGAQNIAAGTTSGNWPMPFAGNIGNLYASLNNATSNGTSSIVDLINNTAGTVTCTFTIAQCTPSGTPSDSFNQGDYAQFRMNIGAGDSWVQTSAGRIGFTITANGGQHAPLFAVASGATTTTPSFGSIGNNNSGIATELTVSSIAPTGFTVVGIWGLPFGGSEGAVGHTLTVCQNNSVSTCTSGTGIFTNITPSSTVGGCGTIAASGTLQGAAGCGQVNLASGIGVHFAAGDTISIKDTCASTCSNTAILITLDIVPDTNGEVPVFAQTSSISSNSSQWAGVSDATFAAGGAGQVGYQVVPNIAGHVTFSKLIACTAVNPGGTTTRLFNFQTGANPTTLPTTGSGPVATTSVANGACPGANAATLLAGNQPAGSLALLAGQTVDTQSISGTGSPALPGASKVSYVAVVGP